MREYLRAKTGLLASVTTSNKPTMQETTIVDRGWDDIVSPRSKGNLAALAIQPLAIIAQSITTISLLALVPRNVTARGARTIVVMHPIGRWLLNLVNGIEF